MPGERKTMEYYTFAGADDTTHASFVAEMSNTFLDDAAQRFPERPLFLHAGFYAPHPPLNPPASALARSTQTAICRRAIGARTSPTFYRRSSRNASGLGARGTTRSNGTLTAGTSTRW